MLPLRSEARAHRFPVATATLVLLCFAAFAVELHLGARLPGLLERHALVPSRVLGPDPLGIGPFRLLAATAVSLFLHAGWLHLLGNMLFLWTFGGPVEGALGPRRHLALFGLAGLAAAAAHLALNPRSGLPAIGASGAIAGLLASYLVLFPRARISGVSFLGLFAWWSRTPAWLYLPLWALLQLASALLAKPGEGGIAWWAHLGGFVAGPPLLWILRPPRSRR
jgi:membrane associated rhomboid family serine protease